MLFRKGKRIQFSLTHFVKVFFLKKMLWSADINPSVLFNRSEFISSAQNICKMKKIFISLTFMSMVLKTNAQNDSVKNVELPAAVIKEQKFQLLDEKNLKEIKIDFLKRTNQTQDVPYVLNGLSNVVVSSDAGTGTGYTDIKVRGTDLNRINVTMNGIPVNDPESQATYFVNTPDLMSSAQSVELVKGLGNSKNKLQNLLLH